MDRDSTSRQSFALRSSTDRRTDSPPLLVRLAEGETETESEAVETNTETATATDVGKTKESDASRTYAEKPKKHDSKRRVEAAASSAPPAPRAELLWFDYHHRLRRGGVEALKVRRASGRRSEGDGSC
jgi:hypothetical protein